MLPLIINDHSTVESRFNWYNDVLVLMINNGLPLEHLCKMHKTERWHYSISVFHPYFFGIICNLIHGIIMRIIIAAWHQNTSHFINTTILVIFTPNRILLRVHVHYYTRQYDGLIVLVLYLGIKLWRGSTLFIIIGSSLMNNLWRLRVSFA